MGNPTPNLIDFASLLDDGFIRAADLKILGITPFSNSTRHRLIKQQKFPQPKELAPNIKPFRVGDIREWLKDPANYKAASRNKCRGNERREPNIDQLMEEVCHD
jgi:prophage regulatory protein|tara:strand:+ start:210 stop:521 length:312 start_codon:yes stop_codon:yes gene_type:complete